MDRSYGRANGVIGEGETTVLTRSVGDDVVHGHGQIASGNTPRGAAEIGECGRIAVSLGGIIGDRGGGDGGQNFRSGRVIGDDLRVE